MYTCLSILITVQASVEPVDLAVFKQQYQAAVLSTRAVYDRVFISESRTYSDNQQQYDLSGGVCGEFIKCSQRSLRNTVDHHTLEFLTRTSRFRIYRKTESDQYVPAYHSYLQVENEYEASRIAMKKMLPDSFRLPFENRLLDLTILEMLEGKPLNSNRYGETQYSVDRIEKHRKLDHIDFYRIHYSLHGKSVDDSRDFVDVDPNLAWGVTWVKAKYEEWRLEYGERIENVPMLKKTTYARGMKDEATHQVTMKPVYIIQVHKPEPYLQVYLKEYDITTYGIMQPARPGDVPSSFWIGFAGIGALMMGVLMIQYWQGKAGKAPKATV